MSIERIHDRKDEEIHEGDWVWTRFRGGVREGEVSLSFFVFFYQIIDLCVQVHKIVKDEKEARDEGVANPPKVGLFLGYQLRCANLAGRLYGPAWGSCRA
jgi:hypothetical protein